MTENRLISVQVIEEDILRPEREQERRVAIFDLIEENIFCPLQSDGSEHQGPFKLILKLHEGQLHFQITDAENETHHLVLSLTPLRQILKDYFDICNAYFEAVKTMPAAQIEAIDMGRRGIHNEGASALQERLEGKIDIDMPTARRLFTLISVLN